jgi:hypothetical protein
MSGLTPLVDTLLTTRLAQRLDLLPLKSELEIASPGAVIQVKKVSNELHLPSRAALQQQLGVGLLKSGAAGYGHGPARAGDAVTLSVAARAVSAILNSQAGATTKITGTEPLWPTAQSVQAPLLAEKLASTVVNSGLFYESHLAQHVVGTYPLAQLAQEPQARLDATPSGAGAAVSTAYDSASDRAPATAASHVAEAIHPETMALVRQQLELLTLPLFRWVGEVWPGTTMDWEIQEEPSERQTADDREATARSWCTRLAMRLPALGAVDVRLTLAGRTLQVHLAAREPATVALLLTDGGHALPQRFGALGLQLTGLRIGALADAPLAES